MRNYDDELKNRIAFIKNTVTAAGADGIVFANSGGKDCALAGILCKLACENTIGIILPCSSKRNYEDDMTDAKILAEQFAITSMTIDLGKIKDSFTTLLNESIVLNKSAEANIAPRLRMMCLYSIAMSQNRLVVGTGNRSEVYMGYFTKWGDGAYDFNPIYDLTVTEVYEFLRYLKAPDCVIKKAPSAGLYEGQTDESEMGISYNNIDNFLLNGVANESDKAILHRYHKASAHKRRMPLVYGE